MYELYVLKIEVYNEGKLFETHYVGPFGTEELAKRYAIDFDEGDCYGQTIGE